MLSHFADHGAFRWRPNVVLRVELRAWWWGGFRLGVFCWGTPVPSSVFESSSRPNDRSSPSSSVVTGAGAAGVPGAVLGTLVGPDDAGVGLSGGGAASGALAGVGGASMAKLWNDMVYSAACTACAGFLPLAFARRASWATLAARNAAGCGLGDGKASSPSQE